MLSRRSVRVKVMQLLYALDRDESLSKKQVVNSYNNTIGDSYELFLFCTYVLYRVTLVSTEDGNKRKIKHLPLDYDKAYTDKLATNVIITDITENKVLQKNWESLDLKNKVSDDYVQKIYYEFSKTEGYRTFILNEVTKEETLELLLELFRFVRQNEYFNETMEDSYYNWVDDKSLVVGSLKKYLKSLPASDNSGYKAFFPEDETVKEFGLTLLKKTMSAKKDNENQITAVLENWDHERLAIIDTILLEMALCEFKEFPTIPSKVTLNEYVELAKNYSTAKSKEFVNGVLDKLMKQMEESGEISKKGRGLET